MFERHLDKSDFEICKRVKNRLRWLFFLFLVGVIYKYTTRINYNIKSFEKNTSKIFIRNFAPIRGPGKTLRYREVRVQKLDSPKYHPNVIYYVWGTVHNSSKTWITRSWSRNFEMLMISSYWGSGDVWRKKHTKSRSKNPTFLSFTSVPHFYIFIRFSHLTEIRTCKVFGCFFRWNTLEGRRKLKNIEDFELIHFDIIKFRCI